VALVVADTVAEGLETGGLQERAQAVLVEGVGVHGVAVVGEVHQHPEQARLPGGRRWHEQAADLGEDGRGVADVVEGVLDDDQVGGAARERDAFAGGLEVGDVVGRGGSRPSSA
jgi:hypothetical protein